MIAFVIRKNGNSLQTDFRFQAIQFKWANMATQIDAARLLSIAAWLKDTAGKVTKESSMGKLFASEISVTFASKQFRFTVARLYERLPGGKYWRDSKLCTIGEVLPRYRELLLREKSYSRLVSTEFVK